MNPSLMEIIPFFKAVELIFFFCSCALARYSCEEPYIILHFFLLLCILFLFFWSSFLLAFVLDVAFLAEMDHPLVHT